MTQGLAWLYFTGEWGHFTGEWDAFTLVPKNSNAVILVHPCVSCVCMSDVKLATTAEIVTPYAQGLYCSLHQFPYAGEAMHTSCMARPTCVKVYLHRHGKQ